MATNNPTAKRRLDYQAPDFLIEQVSLTFTLNPTKTVVNSSLKVTRNGEHSKPLILDGEGLTLLSISLDGKDVSHYTVDETSLTLQTTEDHFKLCISNEINPKDNSSLEGLYLSAGAFCTQCEAEGFRKITYFLDRPDVLATYDVTIIAAKEEFPFLLSNGNKVDCGELENNLHWVKWSDPFKKPCYLFALVAGDFDLVEDTFVTQSKREIALELFVDKGMADRGQHALDSLKKSMLWDEQEFGLEYDLDIYMIVAVDFFNMGAMENKGLNVFNSKFVLANAKTATDEDYFNIESVIAHEYFHNWTGNRITCRDWFQLSLKEGLTVFRDQQFSADMSSPIVNRIKNVKVVREHQFAEDASAMSHPIRPDEVIEMNNFYTVTVYDKGAEVIRMLHTLLGKSGFRAGMDLYFERLDGQAVTCDDFVQSMQDANNKDLTQFKRWYSQSGTPTVEVKDRFNQDTGTYTLEFSQINTPTYDQKTKRDLVIPIQFSLINSDVNEDVQTQSQLLELTKQTQTVEITGLNSRPVPSLLENFSAPVKLNFAYSIDDLATVMNQSKDAFSRWDAGQSIFSQCIHSMANCDEQESKALLNDSVSMFDQIIEDTSIDLALKAEMLTVPSFETLFQQVDSVNIDNLYAARNQLVKAFGVEYGQQWQHIVDTTDIGQYAYETNQVNQRKIRNLALKYIAVANQTHTSALLTNHFNDADNMTDSLGVLNAAQLGSLTDFDTLMAKFEERWSHDPLVLDKWFALHANTARDDILARIDILKAHDQFTLSNPNRVRAVIGSFAFFNVLGFHNKNGSGYKFVADHIIKLNEINPQVASRIITPLIQWQKVDSARQEQMQHQLMRIGDTQNLSKDLYEKITKSLPIS